MEMMAVPSVVNMAKSEKPEKAPPMEWSVAATKTMLSLYKHYKVKVEDKTILTRAKMWMLLNEKMKEKGYNFTPNQVENRWKTLERTYRRHMRESLKNGSVRRTGLYEKEMIELHANDAMNIPDEIIIDPRLDKGMNELFYHHFPIEVTASTAPVTVTPVTAAPFAAASNVGSSVAATPMIVSIDGNVSSDCLLTQALNCEQYVSSPTTSSTTSSNVLPTSANESKTAAVLVQIRQDMQERHLERQLAAQRRHEEKMELIKIKNKLMEKKIELLQSLVDSLNNK